MVNGGSIFQTLPVCYCDNRVGLQALINTNGHAAGNKNDWITYGRRRRLHVMLIIQWHRKKGFAVAF